MAYIIHHGASAYTATNPNGELLVAVTGSGNVAVAYPAGVPSAADFTLVASAANAADQHSIVLTEGTTVTTTTANTAHINTTPNFENAI